MASNETKNKRNPGAEADNEPKLGDWEHKLTVKEYLEKCKIHKEGIKVWTENKGKCYCLVLQHCPPELKPKIKNSERWEEAVSDTDIMSLLLIIRGVMHNKKERA